MAIRQFRARIHIPSLPADDRHQVIRVEGTNWQVALGKVGRQLRQLPAVKGHRIRNFSVVLEQVGDGAEERGLQPEQPQQMELTPESLIGGVSADRELADQANEELDIAQAEELESENEPEPGS